MLLHLLIKCGSHCCCDMQVGDTGLQLQQLIQLCAGACVQLMRCLRNVLSVLLNLLHQDLDFLLRFSSASVPTRPRLAITAGNSSALFVISALTWPGVLRDGSLLFRQVGLTSKPEAFEIRVESSAWCERPMAACASAHLRQSHLHSSFSVVRFRRDN
eukprot:GFYU01031438.1.p1 GENE.GFYU01031438.1~~GFYU01031438.1.p1  ORF type:complete len:158 (+),score=6.17 GFYU01031438.1:142-615(+)